MPEQTQWELGVPNPAPGSSFDRGTVPPPSVLPRRSPGKRQETFATMSESRKGPSCRRVPSRGEDTAGPANLLGDLGAWRGRASRSLGLCGSSPPGSAVNARPPERTNVQGLRLSIFHHQRRTWASLLTLSVPKTPKMLAATEPMPHYDEPEEQQQNEDVAHGGHDATPFPSRSSIERATPACGTEEASPRSPSTPIPRIRDFGLTDVHHKKQGCACR